MIISPGGVGSKKEGVSVLVLSGKGVLAVRGVPVGESLGEEGVASLPEKEEEASRPQEERRAEAPKAVAPFKNCLLVIPFCSFSSTISFS